MTMLVQTREIIATFTSAHTLRVPRTSRHDAREAMRALPTCLQGVLTLLTGKSLKGQAPTWNTPWHHLFNTLISIAAGLIACAAADSVSVASMILLPLGWILIVFGQRTLQVVIIHHCSHNNFSPSSSINKALG